MKTRDYTQKSYDLILQALEWKSFLRGKIEGKSYHLIKNNTNLSVVEIEDQPGEKRG